MKRTRIIKLFNILSEQEKALLKKQIQRSDKDVAFKALANYLLANSNQPEMLENEQIMNAVNKKMTLEKLGQLRFQLFQFVENFVLNNWLNNLPKNDVEHEVQKELLLLEYYKTKELADNDQHLNNLSKLIDLKQKQIKKQLEKNKANNIFHYYYLHRINYHQYYGLNAALPAKGKNYIEAAMNYLDVFYGLAKLKFSGEINLRNILTTEKTKIFGLNKMSKYFDTLEFANIETYVAQPIINLYQLSNRLANHSKTENLTLLKNEIIKHESSLDKNELSQLLTLVINYNTYLSRNNNIDLSETSYELLKLGLKRELFNVNGLIRPDFLINFAYLCTEFSDDKEITSVMKQYESRLSYNLKESTLNICNAFILWYRKEFKEAIALSKIKPRRIFIFFISQKLMQIKCFYELSRADELAVESDYIGDIHTERNSLLKYLRSKKDTLSSYNFQSLLNFCSMLLKLIDLNCSKKQLLDLINFKYAVVFERRWLLRKISEK